MLIGRKHFFFYPDNGNGGGDEDPAEDPPKDPKEETPPQPTWEAYIETQPDDVKVLYEEHVGGLKSALKAERTKAKSAGKDAKRLAELEEKERKAKEDEMTETERLTVELAESDAQNKSLKTQHAEALLRYEVIAQASAAGFIDPNDAYNLIDLKVVEVDDDGKITGVKEALEALVKDKPYLVNKKASKHGTPPGKPKKKPKSDDTKPQPSTVRF